MTQAAKPNGDVVKSYTIWLVAFIIFNVACCAGFWWGCLLSAIIGCFVLHKAYKIDRTNPFLAVTTGVVVAGWLVMIALTFGGASGMWAIFTALVSGAIAFWLILHARAVVKTV
jgi:hypothetical protein